MKRQLDPLKFSAFLVAGVLWFLICATVALLLASVAPKRAHADNDWVIESERSSSLPNGRVIKMWNATGVQITAGTLVMVDTTTTTVVPQIPIGKGFKTWDADPANRFRIVGLLVNDTPGYSQGRVMIEGTYNYALMDSTGATGFMLLRPSLKTAGCLHQYFADPDSLNAAKRALAIFGRYVNDRTTGAQSLRALVYIRVGGLADR